MVTLFVRAFELNWNRNHGMEFDGPRGEHLSSLQFQCDVPTLSLTVSAVSLFVSSSRLMCSPDDHLSLRKVLCFTADALQELTLPRCSRLS